MNYLLGIDNQSISTFNDINNIFEGKLKEFNNANKKPIVFNNVLNQQTCSLLINCISKCTKEEIS